MISLYKLTKWLDASKPDNGLTEEQQEFLKWAATQDVEIDLDAMYLAFHPEEQQPANAQEDV